jgi:hypothetical protein
MGSGGPFRREINFVDVVDTVEGILVVAECASFGNTATSLGDQGRIFCGRTAIFDEIFFGFWYLSIMKKHVSL